jgi:hypothetical protein
MSVSFEESRKIIENTIPKRVLAYFDHCVFFVWGLDDPWRPDDRTAWRLDDSTAWRLDDTTVRQLAKAGFNIRDCRRQSGQRISIKVPSRSALRLVSTTSAQLYGVELALDLTYETAAPVHQALKMCICQPWAGKRRVVDLGGTLYTGQRKQGRHHHFAMYADKPSRITGETDTVHLEKRTRGLPLLRKIGIKDATDMLDFDHVAYWGNVLPRLFLYLDIPRYGRMEHNRIMQAKRRAPLIHDRAWGEAAFRFYSMGGNESTGSTLQRFVQNTGRGRHLEPIDVQVILDRIEAMLTLT